MKPSEYSIFTVLFSFNGGPHYGMTAKEVMKAAGISAASFYRYLPTVPGLTECVFNGGAKKYYIDTARVSSVENLPVAVQTIHEVADVMHSKEWNSAPENIREAVLNTLSEPMDDEKLAKLIELVTDPNKSVAAKAAFHQVLALYYLNVLKAEQNNETPELA